MACARLQRAGFAGRIQRAHCAGRKPFIHAISLAHTHTRIYRPTSSSCSRDLFHFFFFPLSFLFSWGESTLFFSLFFLFHSGYFGAMGFAPFSFYSPFFPLYNAAAAIAAKSNSRVVCYRAILRPSHTTSTTPATVTTCQPLKRSQTLLSRSL